MMKKRFENNLINFIEEEKKIVIKNKRIENWNYSFWDMSKWLPHRGSHKRLAFTEFFPEKKKSEVPLPEEFMNFCKAMIAHIQRTKGVGFIAIHKYLIELKRLHYVMKERGETSPTQLKRWHFERCIELLKENNYKNMYDAASSLRLISVIIDGIEITSKAIDFNHDFKVTSSRHDFSTIAELGSDEIRKNDEKLPSLEAFKAYAICTNNPLDENEEIVIRTIDLLFAMGQRVNEVAYLPYDCWVEQPIIDKRGNKVKNAHGNEMIKYGLRYYAEKKFESRIHWLAEQDIYFAKRAVNRLKQLTIEPRRIAKFQEDNPGRVWDINPEEILDDTFIIEFTGAKNYEKLVRLLTAKGIKPYRRVKDEFSRQRKNSLLLNFKFYYKAGDIEEWLLKKYIKPDFHDQLVEKTRNGTKVILRTSDLLCIRFHGNSTTKNTYIFSNFIPGRIKLAEINNALGANSSVKSIFEVRNLTEADGSRIQLTSHQSRHWRNTLYELAGMSNVQQALAMGRQKLDQNPTYQHTSILERTRAHKEFLSFNSSQEKIHFLHNGIRNKKIVGEITNLYHSLLETKGKTLAESFLASHANAIHLTPFGGCTHDFSQAPCPKHLQCWNGCSHLHRTNTPGEPERIKEQIELSKLALDSMKKEGEDEYGSDVWTNDLEKKIKNMEKALLLKPIDGPLKVFPNGKPFTLDFSQKKGSSVSED